MKHILPILFFHLAIFADYSVHPDAKDVIDELIYNHGFEEEYVISILQMAEKQPKIIKSISKPAEFTWTWDRYKNLFLDAKRIANGKRFIEDNLGTLERAEAKYGVPKEIITAILGVETRYGKVMGGYKVIDSLTTLGFDYPRRAKFFKKELIEFFILTRQNNLDITQVKGSYAGAMGYGQFISSSYRAYAVDFDGNGSADLFNSVDDAIGSIANYLNVHGWQPEGNIVTEIKLNDIRKPVKTHYNVNKIITLEFEEDGEKKYFIGDNNFIAITKYNISHFYAMAIYYLSEEIKA